jgi:transposase InsO family protein
VKYVWIGRHKKQWPITLQCEVLNVSVSGYFEYLRREDAKLPAQTGKRLSDEALLIHIKAVHAASRGEYGWPRIWQELRANGIKAGKERIRRRMKQNGIKARGRRKYVVTTDSRHHLPVPPICSIAISGQRSLTRCGRETSSPPSRGQALPPDRCATNGMVQAQARAGTDLPLGSWQPVLQPGVSAGAG